MIGYSQAPLIELNRSQPGNLLIGDTPESNVNAVTSFPPSLHKSKSPKNKGSILPNIH